MQVRCSPDHYETTISLMHGSNVNCTSTAHGSGNAWHQQPQGCDTRRVAAGNGLLTWDKRAKHCNIQRGQKTSDIVMPNHISEDLHFGRRHA